MEPRVFPNRFAGASGPSGPEPSRDSCQCVGYSSATRPSEVDFHAERQDVEAPGWLHLLELIDEAAADGRPVFKPFVELSAAERRQVVTLPPTVAELTEVRHLVLYGTNLVRLPPEIGRMTRLETFEPYTSHRLHWYPYELSRCTSLRDSTVSTRVMFGNFKHRPPFPRLRPVTPVAEVDLARLDPGLWGAEAVRSCSVCDGPVENELHQVWISLASTLRGRSSLSRAVDVLPMLVNACSAACVAALPEPHANYVPTPHTGGPGVVQPPAR
ncbi:leucine-rich repeat domain-containing protein [Actinoplanes solisilvae]|uniref:leucine-rich repeat domain-containing protein n=1 Tax=Actinoplanes solisilvae TaxID=2486853 RepID=UPI00196B99CD|nr:leucine-rich repeat domain-containing protein [Actinoplanes solisilvae]